MHRNIIWPFIAITNLIFTGCGEWGTISSTEPEPISSVASSSSSGGSGGDSSETWECIASSDCPQQPCVDYTCENHTCTSSFLPRGTSLEDSQPGDCVVPVCDGAGQIENQVATYDVGPSDDCNFTVCEVIRNEVVPAVHYKVEGSSCLTTTEEGIKPGVCFHDPDVGHTACRTQVPVQCLLPSGRIYSCPPLADEVAEVVYFGRDNNGYECMDLISDVDIFYCPTDNQCQVILNTGSTSNFIWGTCVN